MVTDIAELGSKLTQLGESCENVSIFLQLRKKRKEMEDYLDGSIVGPSGQEFIEASRELGQLHRQAKEGKIPNPAEMGRLYTKLGRSLPNFSQAQKEVSPVAKQNPLRPPELEALVKMVDRSPYVPSKRLKAEDLSIKYTSLDGKVAAASSELAKVYSLVAQLNQSLERLPNFNRPEFKELEKIFLSHFKGITQDLAIKQSIVKSSVGQDLEAQFKGLQDWYKQKFDAIKVIITGCVCSHKLTQNSLSPDDEENFRDLLATAKELLKTPQCTKGVMELLAPKVEPFGTQDPQMPVYFPFQPIFALQDADGHDYKLLFGAIPCVPVYFQATYPGLATFVHFCNTVPYNSQVYMPKIMGMLKEEDKAILLFEYVPALNRHFVRSIRNSISEERRKSMVIGLAGILESLARKNLTVLLQPADIQMTRTCQIFITPQAFHTICPFDPKGTPLPIPVNGHPDTIIKANFGLVYVGWLIEFLEFGSEPQKNKLTGGMIKPSEDLAKTPFSASMLAVLNKLYIPNTDGMSRPIYSAVQVVGNTVHPTSTFCVFSTAACGSQQFDHFQEKIKGLQNTGGPSADVGEVNRRKDPRNRFDNYVRKLQRAHIDGLTRQWNYTLVNERDTAGGGGSAVGISPCKELIKDFFDMALEHRIFEEINGKLVLRTTNAPCKSCSTTAIKNCDYFGNQDVYDSLARATQCALVAGVRWSTPFALSTLASFYSRVKTVTQEMCFDVFPLARKILADTEIYGPIQKDKDGEILQFQLGNVTEPFGIPHTIDMDQYFPQLSIGLTVPVELVPLYLMDFLQTRTEETERFSSYFRNGFGGSSQTDFWKTFTKTPIPFMLQMICETSDYIQPDLFVKKIRFSTGFENDGGLGTYRKTWFHTIMCKKENNSLRRGFLRAVTGATSISPHLRDEGISLSVASHDSSHGNNLTRDYGGVQIQACFEKIKIPFFDRLETLEVILAAVCSSGTDFFTMV